MVTRTFMSALAVLTLSAVAAFAVACGDEDEDPAPTQSAATTAEPDPQPDPEADPEPDPEADPEAGEASEGVAQPRPGDATQFDVTLKEWEITAPATVAAGRIYFLAKNDGPEDAHEMVVIGTDDAPDALPVEDGAVPESSVNLISEIEPFTPGSSASLLLNLDAGSYVLICNIAQVEDGALESHYELGMRTAFSVE